MWKGPSPQADASAISFSLKQPIAGSDARFSFASTGTVTMAIVSSDQLDQLASKTDRVLGTMFAYDANGNLDTTSAGWDYDWNVENLMTVAKLNGGQQHAYTYDGFGRRVETVEGAAGSGAWAVSITSGLDAIYEKDQAGAITKYVYANGMRIAKINPDATVHYFLGDHFGSTLQVRKADRSLVFSAEYDPFGRPYSVTGTEAYKFSGERTDDPTGLTYFRDRQYDPDLGRLVSTDRTLGAPMSPQTTNQYSYVTNNPLTYEIGQSSSSALVLKAAGGGFLGGTLSLYLMGAYERPVPLGKYTMYGYSYWKFWEGPTGWRESHVKFQIARGGDALWKFDYGPHSGGRVPKGWHAHTPKGFIDPYPAWKGRAFEWVGKWGGKAAKGLVGLAAAIDAYRLYGAIEYARQTGDWSAVGTEAAVIAGGWAGAFAGAYIGMIACAPAGPIGVGVCGVAGGIIGGILGEEAVEALVNTPPEALIGACAPPLIWLGCHDQREVW